MTLFFLLSLVLLVVTVYILESISDYKADEPKKSTKRESYYENWNEDYESWKIKKEAEDKAKTLGKNLLNPVEDKKQLDLIATNQLKWKTVVKSSRDGDKANTLINELAFNLLRPESRDGVTLENGDYVVVRLKHINDGTLGAMDKEQKDSLIQQVEASYGMMDYDLYVNSLINHAEVERH